MDKLELKIPPPVVALVIGGAMWLVAKGVPSAAFDLPWRHVLAFIVVGCGGGFALAAIIRFVKAKTTIQPEKPAKTSAIVTSGIYRVSRNPMYLGSLLVLAGWGIWLSNALAFLPLPLFVAWINRFQIAPEERILSAKFSAAYDDYRKTVRRWL